MTTEEKFNAAVNVIRSLPKNGSYQPSNELMLRFYSYFKQATQGPCSGTRPGFWDIVGRAKYDAWKRLGDMSRNEAMRKYVDELHSIVETMSYSDKVANFLEAPTNELDGINIDDLELVAGDVLERVRSQPNSPLASREGSPIRFLSSVHSSRSASPSIPTEDESEDEYLEPFDGPNVHDAESEMEANLNYIPNGIDGGTQLPYRPRRRSHTCTVDISREVAIAVENLRLDVLSLDDRIHVLESLNKRSQKKRENIFGDVVPELIAFMVLWPFLACFIVNRWMLRRK